MTHYWRVKRRMPWRFDHPCEILAHGKKNSIAIRFWDGEVVICSRYDVRRRR